MRPEGGEGGWSWGRLELEVLPDEQLMEMYGSTDLEEIIRGELEGTQEVWDERGQYP